MDFDFIGDEQFRSSLESDYREMRACQDAGSWKAIHVLAGSIVEALLIEYLSVSGTNIGGRDVLRLDLNDAIQACADAGVIQRSTASLCDVIRGYRNLIHPGRIVRLQQEVTPQGANIAINLVELITKEVSARRKLTYGPTAEQIVKKLRTDHHSMALLPQLLSEANQHERTKLVSALIPEAYDAAQRDFYADDDVPSRLRLAYRQTLELLPASGKKKIAERFAKLVREDSGEKIQNYSDAFFYAEEIAHLQPKDAAIVTKYLTTRLEQGGSNASEEMLESMVGIEKFISDDDFSTFINNLVRFVLRQQEDSVKRVLSFAGQVFDGLDDAKQQKMQQRAEAWITFSKDRNYPLASQARLADLANKWFYVPF